MDPLVGSIALGVSFAVCAWGYRSSVQVADETRTLFHQDESFRRVYRWIQMAVPIAALGALWTSHPVLLEISLPAVLSWLGLGLSIAAWGLFLSAKRALGTCYSPCYEARVPRAAVLGGPYRWIRHPIYTANLLTLLSLLLMSGCAWILFAVCYVASAYWRSALREEEVLCERSSAYRERMRRTGMFCPRWRVG